MALTQLCMYLQGPDATTPQLATVPSTIVRCCTHVHQSDITIDKYYCLLALLLQVISRWQGQFQDAPEPCEWLHRAWQDCPSCRQQQCEAAQGEPNPRPPPPLLCQAQEAGLRRLWGAGLCAAAKSNLS